MTLHKRLRSATILLALAFSFTGFGSAAAGPAPADDLVGLWEAKRQFGPEITGTLALARIGRNWRAEIAGFRIQANIQDGAVSFALPGDRGSFRGRLTKDGTRVKGHWIQPRMVRVGLAEASPVTLLARGPNRWVGDIQPMKDTYTFYLVIRKRPDGSTGAFLRNPDRNLGVFTNIDRVVRDGNDLEFIGTFFNRQPEKVMLKGVYDPRWDTFRVYINNRGGSYDFRRVDDDPASPFYGRGKDPKPLRYHRPTRLDDGWKTASLKEVGISFGPIREMIEKEIDPPAANVHAQYVHGLLIARHGKLVFEEYFHGYTRETAHDTRSASKSLTAVLVGAAIESGVPLSTSSPVYETIYGAEMPANLDPRKERMTLEHLLTMSSGYFCDDSDPKAPGNEETMQEQEAEPDWYKYTLALPMAMAPGEKAIYCSVNPNLIGAVLSAASGQTLPELFQSLIAEPLQMKEYHLMLQPTGEPYMGGGIHWLPRDFAKLGQLMLNGGVWNGRRVISKAWAERSISKLYEIRGRQYGYLWWIQTFPYKEREVRAFMAGGNGGNVIIAVPELDLVVTFFGGNYSDRVLFRVQDVLFPEYILAAVEE
ncbi:MAG: serine hydrolase [Sphingomonadales bacterium]